MRRLNIGLLADQFVTWGGGIDFLRIILNGLNSVNGTDEYEIDVFVYVPIQSEFKIRVKNLVKRVLNTIFFQKFQSQNMNIEKRLIVESFKSINQNINIIYYNGSEKNLSKKVLIDKVDFVLPAFKPLSSKFPKPWAGYIYDFQHKYYPEFFTDEHIKLRNDSFSAMIRDAEKVIVNAKAVKNDIEKFIDVKNTKIITLPFCPVLNMDYFENLDLSDLNIPENYFMISNQFWKHKDHITAFKAFKAFIQTTGNTEIGLVCTGQTVDYRFPNYFLELEELITALDLNDRIFILGYIPKKQQLQILKKSIAVIQPTLFEGGPGGGAIYESVAYGIPSIVSDIPVNLELNEESVVFFNAGSSIDLMDKMKIVYSKARINYTFDELMLKNEKRMLAMGKQIIKTITD